MSEKLSESELEFIANVNEFMRSTLSRRFSVSGSDRDIDAECHYPASVSALTAELYRDMYDRFGIATRVVDLFPMETWGVNPQVYEVEAEDTETDFERAWKDVSRSLGGSSYFIDEETSPIWEYLQRVDRLSGIGRFGVLLLGLGIPGSLEDPVPGFEDDRDDAGMAYAFNQRGGTELLYLRAFDESLVDVDVYESRLTSKRYGQPIYYRLTLSDPMIQHEGIGHDSGREVRVHWSRVIHVADNLMSSEIYGVPRMQPVYNHLLDLRKLYGGSAEMFWQGAFPGLSFETHPSLGNTVRVDHSGMKDQVESYMNGLQRYLAMTGVSAKQLAPAVADPTAHIERTLDAICVQLGVPKRLFMGSERGELASSQDRNTWEDRLNDRRAQYCNPRIIRPFIDRLIGVGVLPAPREGYHVKWPDSYAPTPSERAAVATQRMQAVSAYIQSGADVLIPPMEFLVKELDYDREEAEEILRQSAEEIVEEDEEEEDEVVEPTDVIEDEEMEVEEEIELAANAELPPNVKLNKPFRTPDGPAKFAVYTKNDKGNIVLVRFGDPNLEIKRDDKERRANFRARHGCDDPGPKWKARYWSCKMWSEKPVSEIVNAEDRCWDGYEPTPGKKPYTEGSCRKVANVIRELPDGTFRLYSEDGKNLGTFATKEEAEEHEREVLYFKAGTENAWVTTEDGNRLFVEDGGLKTGPGGKSVGGGGSGSAGGAKSSHSVKLPKDRTKLKMSQASQALSQMGYRLGRSKTDLQSKVTRYEVTDSSGRSRMMTTDEIKATVYSAAT